MKLTLFFCIWLVIINFSNAQTTDCGKPQKCDDKLYPFMYCDSNQRKIVYKCTSNPHNDTIGKPLRINLPLCAKFDNSYNSWLAGDTLKDKIYMYDTNRIIKYNAITNKPDTTIKIDTILVFEKSKMYGDLKTAVDEWNCLCNKQDEEPSCCVKIRWSNRGIDFSNDSINVQGIAPGSLYTSTTDTNCVRVCDTQNVAVFLNYSKALTNRKDSISRQFYNGDKPWFLDSLDIARNRTLSLIQLIQHELGHYLGFLHFDENEETGRVYKCKSDTSVGVMNDGGSAYPNSPRLGLTNDDKCRFMKLYCPEKTSGVQNKLEVSKNCLKDIYPNPTSKSLKIPFELNKSELVKMCITNLKGKILNQVFKEELTQGKYTLDLDIADYPNGIYFLQVEMGKTKANKKFIINK
ncbi:MAG: T9SS type A sorting domain-containing protein [Chlorobiota bacterium]|jgi:hypothetical protein|nr:MAG: T9SS type A sorting domain-containing protein [Chlorobiota bacterium]